VVAKCLMLYRLHRGGCKEVNKWKDLMDLHIVSANLLVIIILIAWNELEEENNKQKTTSIYSVITCAYF